MNRSQDARDQVFVFALNVDVSGLSLAAKTFQEEAVEFRKAYDDFINELDKAFRVSKVLKWLDDKLKKLNYK